MCSKILTRASVAGLGIKMGTSFIAVKLGGACLVLVSDIMCVSSFRIYIFKMSVFESICLRNHYYCAL